MHIDDIGASLGRLERKKLASLFKDLASPDPARRAESALQATELLQRVGLSWQALLPPIDDDQESPPDWREHAEFLLNHPGLTKPEADEIRKILRWRAPGKPGLAKLRAISDRLKVED